MKINSEHGMKLLCCSILIRSAIDWKKVRNRNSVVIGGNQVNREEVRLFLNSSFLNDILAAYWPEYDQQYVVDKINQCNLKKFSIGPSKEQARANQRIYNANWYRKKKNLSVSGEG